MEYLKQCMFILNQNSVLYDKICFNNVHLIDEKRLDLAHDMNLVGKDLPVFEFDEKKRISSGQYGQVFRNGDTVDKIIILHAKDAEMEPKDYMPFLALTIRECAFLKSLIHFNVIRVLSIDIKFQDQRISQFKINMDYMEHTLKEYMFLKEISIDHVQDFISGIHWCHVMGICHADISMDNILVDKDGNLKLTDFGISLNKSMYISIPKGTFEWSAPELWTKNNAPDWDAVDTWALGIVLLNILFQGSLLKILNVERGNLYDYFYQLCCFLKKVPKESTVLEHFPSWKDNMQSLRHKEKYNEWPEFHFEFNKFLSKETKIYLVKVASLCLEWDPKDRVNLKDLSALTSHFYPGNEQSWICEWHNEEEKEQWTEYVKKFLARIQNLYSHVIFNVDTIVDYTLVITCQMRSKMIKHGIKFDSFQWLDIVCQFNLFVWYNIPSPSQYQFHFYYIILKSLDFLIMPVSIKDTISQKHFLQHSLAKRF